MTTTAHEDQFTTGTQTIVVVREVYDTVAILRRNIADAEKEMQHQADRAESYAEALRSLASYVGAGGHNADTVDAGVFEEKIRWGIGEIMKRMEKVEAELAKLREQKPVGWADSRQLRTGTSFKVMWSERCWENGYAEPIYASPVPAPAVDVPAVPADIIPDDMIPDGDDFNGTTPHMIKCIESLVAMNDRGTLVPHGLCGHSRTLLLASANRLRQQAVPAVPDGLRDLIRELRRTDTNKAWRGSELCLPAANALEALLQSAEVTK